MLNRILASQITILLGETKQASFSANSSVRPSVDCVVCGYCCRIEFVESADTHRSSHTRHSSEDSDADAAEAVRL